MADISIYGPTTYQVFTGYLDNAVNRHIGSSGLSARYQQAAAVSSVTSDVIDSPTLSIDLMPLLKGSIVQGSLRFKIGTYEYVDRGGALYHSVTPASGAGTLAGTVNYATGAVSITSWPSGPATFTLLAGLVNPGTPGMGLVSGHVNLAPLKSQSFSITATALDGTALSATAAADGTITGTEIKGGIDISTGIFSILFGHEITNPDTSKTWVTKLVDPSSLKFNAVSYSYLPLDASIIGLDPVRLPQDGRVPIFRKGTYVVVGHTATVGPQTVSNAQTIDCGRVRLSRVRVIGNNGLVIDTGYTANLEAGTVTFSNVTGYSQPVTIEHRIEDMTQVIDAQISGDLKFGGPISHAYPIGSTVSAALVAGDRSAYTEKLFDQSTWNGTWSDTIVGSAATGTYNQVLSPIEVTNIGASTERWVFRFTNASSFEVIGEHVGVIATGSINTDCAPVNPATGQPYFTVRALGWGTGWAVGNILRFNTIGALFPVWVVRTVQQGPETVIDDSFTLLIRGDVDRP